MGDDWSGDPTEENESLRFRGGVNVGVGSSNII